MLMKYSDRYHHIGIPTEDMDQTTAFYTGLGFEQRWVSPDGSVKFFRYGGVEVESYIKNPSAKQYGAVDHIALHCTDITACVNAIREKGYKIADGPTYLPFLEHGVLYIMIEGPNVEKIEFVQEFISDEEGELHRKNLGV